MEISDSENMDKHLLFYLGKCRYFLVSSDGAIEMVNSSSHSTIAMNVVVDVAVSLTL